jgi:hypothetical protein
MNQAIKPDYFAPIRKAQEEADKLGVLPSENHLAHMAEHPGWSELKDYIKTLKEILDGMVKVRMSQGASKEEIGEAAVLAELCKDNLNKIIEKVEDSKDAVESARAKAGGSE